MRQIICDICHKTIPKPRNDTNDPDYKPLYYYFMEFSPVCLDNLIEEIWDKDVKHVCIECKPRIVTLMGRLSPRALKVCQHRKEDDD